MSILVWLEQVEEHIVHSCWEALAKGRELAESLETELAALIVGADTAALAAEAQRYGPDVVYTATAPELARYRVLAYSQLLQQAIATADATVVLTSATLRGRELSAVAACQLDAGLAPDVVELRVEGGRLVGVRTLYSGNILADIHCDSALQFASVRPRSYPAPQPGPPAGRVESLPLSLDEAAIGEEVLEVRPAATGKVSLTDASIIVSGGRGVAADPARGFELVAELAEALGAAVGASRAAVDAGYIPYAHQVGQTGKTVRPDLYIAVGISGAIQHLAGMGNSKVIVAINKDREAPIFERATYGIVDDLFEVLPALTAEFERRLGR